MSQQGFLVKCRVCGSKNRIRLVVDSLKPVCGQCKSELQLLEKPVQVGATTFEEEVLKWPGLVVVDFWAAWCAPCRTIAPVLEELARERSGRLKVAKVDTEAEPQLAAQFGIRSIPTLLLFRDGKLVDRAVGALPKGELIRWIDAGAYLV